MKIPKSITLAARHISVKYVKTLIFDDSAQGMAHYRRKEIYLQKSTASYPIPKHTEEENFIHEALHNIFNIANITFDCDEKEEDTIDRMTPYLHQFIKQVEG